MTQDWKLQLNQIFKSGLDTKGQYQRTGKEADCFLRTQKKFKSKSNKIELFGAQPYKPLQVHLVKLIIKSLQTL